MSLSYQIGIEKRLRSEDLNSAEGLRFLDLEQWLEIESAVGMTVDKGKSGFLSLSSPENKVAKT